jgi:thiol-disulfide isomerase/thioredoxin
MRRIEVIEVLSHDGGKEVKRDLGSLEDGLPIGAIPPDFALKDLGGRTVATKDLLAKKKPLVLLFVSPTCAPCAALLPEIEQWLEDFRERVEFVIMSSGNASENAEKFGGKSFKPILLQNDREVAAMFRAQWTPAAIFINYKGVIGSSPAIGDTAIRELIAKLRAETPESLFAFAPKEDGNGLKIGDDVPDFSLKDLHDREITAKDLAGKPTLITNWSTSCGYCAQMIRDLEKWDREKGADEPNLLVLSQSKPEDLKGLELKSPIVFDQENKTAEKFGMSGTPSAILINENGKIVSEVAVGEANIWALLGRRKS